MDEDTRILQEKALLLTIRERELMTLRNKHQRLLNWLTLTQSLPELVDRRLSLQEIGSKLVRKIISAIKLQRVELLEILPGGMRRFGTERSTLSPLAAEAIALLGASRSGFTNEPGEGGERTLAEAVRLHRLLWYRLDLFEAKMVVLIGGFDSERAASYMPFDREDIEHFAHAGQHFESLLSNVLLLNELERDKLRLKQFNEDLEDRVRVRTAELARANQETNQALGELKEKDRRLSDDLAQARNFQQRILPLVPPPGRIEFGAEYRPLDMVGGDVYDIAEIGPEHYRIFMADATGHGVQASLRTIALKSEYDRIKHSHTSPESLLVDLNRRLLRSFAGTELLCTACCFDLKLEPKGATLHYSNAAHPPLLHRSSRGIEEIYHPGPFLGLSSEIEPQGLELHLEPGELILAYSDGLSEQPGPDGTVFALATAVEKIPDPTERLQASVVALCDSLDAHRGTVPQADDISVVAARI